LANDFLSDEDFERMLDGWFGNIARVLAPGRGFYIWGGFTNCANYPPVLKKHSLYFSQAIIWMKEHPVLTRKDFMTAHEWAFYGWRQGAAHQFYAEPNIADVWRLTRGEAGTVALGRGIRVETPEGSRLDILPPANARKLRCVPVDDAVNILTESGPSDVWSIKKIPPQRMIHLTEKPVELAVRAITYSSKPGENVLDLFGGSGSTLIACEQTGRKAFLMELDALYCDVIVKRWEEFTGGKAHRIAGVEHD
jgi:DNA modification methylase